MLPTGGFCHSYGLEAAIKTKYIDAAQTPEYILESIEQAASLYLPVIRNTMEQPTLETWCRMDELCGALLTNQVASRASIAQVCSDEPALLNPTTRITISHDIRALPSCELRKGSTKMQLWPALALLRCASLCSQRTRQQ